MIRMKQDEILGSIRYKKKVSDSLVRHDDLQLPQKAKRQQQKRPKKLQFSKAMRKNQMRKKMIKADGKPIPIDEENDEEIQIPIDEENDEEIQKRKKKPERKNLNLKHHHNQLHHQHLHLLTISPPRRTSRNPSTK